DEDIINVSFLLDCPSLLHIAPILFECLTIAAPLNDCTPGEDCNGNGVWDICDVSHGSSADCNGNDTPDECEVDDQEEIDCNGNGVPDECDIAEGSSRDCDGNGLPDECDPLEDCNGNGIQDICDIAAGTSYDCNENRRPDECDIDSGASDDCNGNGRPDECDRLGDCNENGIQDICDIAGGLSDDCNGNGLPDECEIDADGDGQVIYSNKNSQFLFRPGRGVRVADDLITKLVGPCSLNTLRVRVTGGVEGGGGVFRAELKLFDGCPASGVGTEIPGTRTRFNDLADDLALFHDLVLDFSDRGICDDLSACEVSQQNCADKSVCVDNPLQIPPTVWVQIRFDTDEAAIVVGSPPTIGFSSDGYHHPFGRCTSWFGGWPTWPHASFWVELTAPVDCEKHFPAYSAANPNRPPFLPTDIAPPDVGTLTTRLGDDIRLSVDDCILDAFEIGMRGFAGPYEMSIDLRWPTILDVIPETIQTFFGTGQGSVEVARFTIPPEIELSIDRLDQPIYITWAAGRANTGAIDVHAAQIGFSGPEFFAFDTDPNNPETWNTLFEAEASPAVFYAAVYCRGEPPLGACCPLQDAVPGLDMACVDDVPSTSCLGARWLEGTSCEENLFDPPCGTHACCLPNDTACENRTFDDCVEDCVTDFNPVFCEPVCVGGPNHHVPCADDTECGPDGLCDADGLCPGRRTCGLSGCQLNGEFTGRPCDLTGPDQGAGDCMTCSGSGEYCRPRCVDGLRRGRPCDPAGDDCPNSTCDIGFDCPSGQTCVSDQVCGHDANLCSPRCARWLNRSFCGEGDQSCPNFTCFDAFGDCFEEEQEIVCLGRCSLDPAISCLFDSDCAPSLGVCEESDADCPAGSRCLHELRVCTGRVACDDLGCCASVCAIRPECCDDSPGQIWDSSCVATAANICFHPPGNDECWSTSPNEGAFEILLENDLNGTLCRSEATSCTGSKFASNETARSEFSDPGFCCNKRGVGEFGAGSVWFKFQAAHTTARVHTCNTPASETAVDSLMQVFRASNISDNGNDYDECNSLEVIGCNDDSGCGVTGELASVCVAGLTPGETYYIEMASDLIENEGLYQIDVESPCPTDPLPPPRDCSCGMVDLTNVTFADDVFFPFNPFDQPHNCAIDAREPQHRSGWDRMVLSFSCSPFVIGMTVSSSSVGTTGAGDAPQIVAVVTDRVAHTVTVFAHDMMTPGEWTCIEHLDSGQRWCAGYLPGDAKLDGLVTGGDIIALIDSINLVPGRLLPNYATDINRSGVTTGADILRLIDLLNGAGEFDAWITRSLSLCPSEP
ncbi:MAG: hypothetical protein IIC51_04765, partial [Planctomycetes bacterium]|nr:hypothetical protein [Planctomycetota bacterium]